MHPDYLVFAASHYETSPPGLEALSPLPGWSMLGAVINRRYAVISDAVNRPAPRIVTAIEDLARQLHPDAFVEKPENGRQKLEKENPAGNQQLSSHDCLSPRDPQADGRTSGGGACAR